MKIIVILLSLLLLVSCTQAPSTQIVEVTRIIDRTVMVTQRVEIVITATPLPATATPEATFTTEPTHTATYTPGPTNTPYPSATPTETLAPYAQTATAQAAIDAILQSNHEPGFYLVGVDIAPGIWRSTPGLDDCYWSRNDKTGDIIDNYFGYSGATMYISPSDFSVEMHEECGIWTYLSAP